MGTPNVSGDATLAVAERFVSINGEGLQAGRLATFVRFCGCNLACSYCDTRWACEPAFEGEQISVAELLSHVADAGCACVTLTGGEPLLQPALPDLVEALLRADGSSARGFAVEIETNGAVSLEPLAQLRQRMGAEHTPGTLSFTMDWKSPSSGMSAHMLAENLSWLTKCDTLKFVVGSREDLDAMRELVVAQGLTARTNVLISPVFGCIEPQDIVEYMKEHSLIDVRLQLQLHKFIWPPSQRGV